MEAVRIALRWRCSNQSTLYARTVITVLASNRSFSHFHSQVEHNASLFHYVLCLLRNTVQIYEKSSNNERKREKILGFCGFKGSYNTVLAINIRRRKGKRYVQTGRKIRCNRERNGVSLVVGGRPHELGRPPLYIGAPALTYPSGRSEPIFIP